MRAQRDAASTKREQRMLEIFDGLAGKRVFRSGSVVGAVIRKLNIGDVEMSLGRVV